MAKYKLTRNIFKLSDQKSYETGEEIELTDKEAVILIADGTVLANVKEAKKK